MSGYLPALRFDALTRFYDPVAALTVRERAFKARVVELAAPRPGEHVVDVGCGTGTLALALRRAQPAARVSGVDGDPEILARAATKGGGIELHEALAQELPFVDASVDVAVSSLFFHHLRREAKEQVAAELVRVLRPGGRVVIADWGAPRDPLMRAASLIIRTFDGEEPTRDNLAGRLPEILAAAGLEDVRERDSFRTAFGRLALLTGRAR